MSGMRVLVTGSAGQLARAIRETWTGHELIMPDESVLDLSRREAMGTDRMVPWQDALDEVVQHWRQLETSS